MAVVELPTLVEEAVEQPLALQIHQVVVVVVAQAIQLLGLAASLILRVAVSTQAMHLTQFVTEPAKVVVAVRAARVARTARTVQYLLPTARVLKYQKM